MKRTDKSEKKTEALLPTLTPDDAFAWRDICDTVIAENKRREAEGMERFRLSREANKIISNGVIDEGISYDENDDYYQNELDGMEAYRRVLEEGNWYGSDGTVDSVRFETLPAYMTEKLPAREGSIKDLTDGIHADIRQNGENRLSFYEAVYQRRDLVPSAARKQLGDAYKEYEQRRTDEDITSVVRKMSQKEVEKHFEAKLGIQTTAGDFVGLGINYGATRKSAEYIEKTETKPKLATPKKTATKTSGKKPRSANYHSTDMLNSCMNEDGTPNSYGFDEYD